MATEVQQMHSHLLSCVVPFPLKNVKKTKFYHFQKSQRAGVSRTYNHLYVNFYLLPLTRTISGYNPASGYKLFITSTAVITPKPFGLLIYKSSSPFITIAWPVITISYICPSHKTIKVGFIIETAPASDCKLCLEGAQCKDFLRAVSESVPLTQ